MPTEITVSKSFTFEASHILPKHRGKCARLHGHSWGLTVGVKGPVLPGSGFVVDFTDISDLVRLHVVDKLDHTHLGQHKAITGPEGSNIFEANSYGISMLWKPYFGWDFYPTSENLCHAIARILQPFIKELSPDAKLYEVTIRETCTSAARWCADDIPVFAHDSPGPDGCTF